MKCPACGKPLKGNKNFPTEWVCDNPECRANINEIVCMEFIGTTQEEIDKFWRGEK